MAAMDMERLRQWWQQFGGRAEIPEPLWRQCIGRLPLLQRLDGDELERLRILSGRFLHEKSISGADDLTVTDEMRLTVAAQACLLILNLGFDYFDGWHEVILYPGPFVTRHQIHDEDGVVHELDRELDGESWPHGPVILSWPDCGHFGDGINVILHEFAHKLDMLNGGDANGLPPLHADMTVERWSAAFNSAYEDHCQRVDHDEEVACDPYASESPAEFFAVISEAFFETPELLQEIYPRVYGQLALFYRQDPAARERGEINQLTC